ncbi:DUF924 family protein [Inhella gelatinilytica]|uniref:DUF924 domain-containing protein n=1 Tax=Inhella gelatinilytica TaxID=2795030 RepID=A0A931NC74_9BURK|nr:DUF924 family protein [Inhella gelatinilytica]MBH9551269.1 DUF924 domain-containing protein [Inhella gelatinilytica]
MLEDVLAFWFQEIPPAAWWRVDPAFDDQLRQRFGGLLVQAAQAELTGWRSSAHGRLAEVLVLDQFSRNIHRGTPQAFAQDGIALVLAQEAVRASALEALTEPSERAFLLMPYMHSESPAIHALAEPLFRLHAPANLDFELRHRAIVDRFGRYPHRNAILGRVSTPEELAFLQQPGSSF